MNQKIKYYSLLFTLMLLGIIYYKDINLVKDKVKNVQYSIKEVNSKLQAGSTILDEVNQIRRSFIENKQVLVSQKISGTQLMTQLSQIKSLADQIGIEIDDMEIDPRNTFPMIDSNDGNEQVSMERHSVNFKLSGNFMAIGRFIDEVQNNHRMLQMQHCSIGLDSLDPRGVIAQLGYLTYGGPES